MQQSKKNWRSLLYVPANNEKFLAKAHQREADAVILDLEDGVPFSEKVKARGACKAMIEKLAQFGVDPIVRVNSPLRLAVADIESAIYPGLVALLLPKVESAEELLPLSELVTELEIERGMPVGAVGFIPIVETPAALFKAAEIAKGCTRNCAMMLGSEDFATASNMQPSQETLLQPKLTVLMAAKSANINALGLLDSVAKIEGDDVLELVQKSARFGFDGATCIHPAMVAVLNQGFSPSAEELEKAKRIVAAMEAGFSEGKGAVKLDGRMIDLPIYQRALNVLAKQK